MARVKEVSTPREFVIQVTEEEAELFANLLGTMASLPRTLKGTKLPNSMQMSGMAGQIRRALNSKRPSA